VINMRAALVLLPMAMLAGHLLQNDDSSQELVGAVDRNSTAHVGLPLAQRSARRIVLAMDRPALEDAVVDPFSPPAPVAPVVTVPAPPPPVAAPPPMPFRYFGRVTGFDGVAVTYLMRNDDLVSVSAGDILDGVYRVESVEASGVVIVYQPLAISIELRPQERESP